MFTFFVLRRKITVLGRFGSKNQNFLFKMKLGAQTNSNMLYSRVMFICPVTAQKMKFFIKDSFSKLTKSIVSLIENFIFCAVCFGLEISFVGKLDARNQNCFLKMKVCTQTNSNMLNLMKLFIYPALDGKYTFSFWTKLVQKTKLSV